MHVRCRILALTCVHRECGVVVLDVRGKVGKKHLQPKRWSFSVLLVLVVVFAVEMHGQALIMIPACDFPFSRHGYVGILR